MNIDELVVIGDSHTSQYGFDNLKSYKDIKLLFNLNFRNYYIVPYFRSKKKKLKIRQL